MNSWDSLGFIACAILMVSRAADGFNCLGLLQDTSGAALAPEGLVSRSIFKFSEPDYRQLVKFHLYTRVTNPSRWELFLDDLDTFKRSSFNPANPTKIVIHGYINTGDSESVQNIKNAFLERGDFNVIGVDWGLITNTPLYNVAAEQTEPVGHYLAAFIQFLMDQGAHPGDIHLIGHSLGAHVAGFAGSNLNGTKLGRISGLDPAKPCFHNSPPELRLDGGDADFVDCIHTCGGYLGIMETICQADFYPNGGVERQPGCSWFTLGKCSHERSYHYYAESILPDHGFTTLQCSQIPTKSLDNCKHSPNLMGYQASPGMPGVFYAATRESFPFSFYVTATT